MPVKGYKRYTHTHACMHASLHILTLHSRIHTQTHAHTHTNTNTHMHTTHMHTTHTHMHTYTLTLHYCQRQMQKYNTQETFHMGLLETTLKRSISLLYMLVSSYVCTQISQICRNKMHEQKCILITYHMYVCTYTYVCKCNHYDIYACTNRNPKQSTVEPLRVRPLHQAWAYHAF